LKSSGFVSLGYFNVFGKQFAVVNTLPGFFLNFVSSRIVNETELYYCD